MHTVKYIFAFSIAVAALAASGVFAQVGSQVSFPIPELGNCVGEDECRAYCDESANADSCNAWARGRGIDVREAPPIPKEEVQADVRRRRSVVRIAIIRNTKISVLIFPFLEDS